MKLNIQILSTTNNSIVKKYYEYTDFDFINYKLNLNIKNVYGNLRNGNYITNIEIINSILGTHSNYRLKVNAISASRKEIELKMPIGNILNVSYNSLLTSFNGIMKQYAPNFLKTNDYKLRYVYLDFLDDDKYQIINFIGTKNNTIVFKLNTPIGDDIIVGDDVIIYEKLYNDIVQKVKLVPLNNDSVYDRISNFKYKLQMIENYDGKINILPPSSVDIVKYTNIIESIIKSFDIYEYYLYYKNEPNNTYPKDINGNNLPLSDELVESWFVDILSSAELYDKSNVNLLLKIVPDYIFTNEYNVQYLKFVSLMGQHFDILWLYILHSGDLKIGNSDINKGLSEKLIYQVLRDFNWKPISNFEDSDLTDYLYKQEHDDSSLVYASDELVSKKQIDLEFWKRLLDNVVFLYKTKGTKEGVRALLNIYGIPSTTLLIQEFGGNHPYYVNNYFDYDKFIYALDKTTNNSANITFEDLKFRGFEVRVKITNESDNIILTSSDDTIQIYTRFSDKSLVFNVNGNLTEINNTDIYNGEWWNINVSYNALASENVDGVHDFDYTERVVYTMTLTSHVDNIIYSRNYKSIPITSVVNIIDELNDSKTFVVGSSFSGYIQEVRFWNQFIGYNNVIYHTLAPTTISNCDATVLYDDLLVRLALGTDLNTYNHATTTTIPNQAPSRDDSITITFNGFDNENNYMSLVEKYYHVVPDISNNHAISRKIRYNRDDTTTCSAFGDTFTTNKNGSFDSSFDSSFDIGGSVDDGGGTVTSLQLSMKTNTENKNVSNNKIGVYFSTANETNNSIYDFFGGNNIDNYIGDSESEFSNSYKLLDPLVNYYQQQYDGKYDVWAYFRMMKQYNKSIFYHLYQILPLRTTNILGATVENDILHRKKVTYLQTDPNITDVKLESELDMMEHGVDFVIDDYLIDLGLYNNKLSFDYELRETGIGVNILHPKLKQYYYINGELIYSNRSKNYIEDYTEMIIDNGFRSKLNYITTMDSIGIGGASTLTDSNQPIVTITHVNTEN